MQIDRVTSRSMRRDIGWALALKFSALGVLKLLFFSAGQQPNTDPAATGRHVAGTTVVGQTHPAVIPATEVVRD
jgi:hypothetical protein